MDEAEGRGCRGIRGFVDVREENAKETGMKRNGPEGPGLTTFSQSE
jgi:hypothetical protein